MLWKTSLMYGQASSFPPGIKLGPHLAPSSPPDTPVPTKRMPFSARYLQRLFESGKCEFPPSMIMSPCSIWGSNFSMKSSTAGPAMTSSIIRRGFLSLEVNSSMECVPTIDLPTDVSQHHLDPLLHLFNIPLASFARKRSTFETVRLKQMTVKPWSAALRMRFWPMTARPMRPKSPLGSGRAERPALMPANLARAVSKLLDLGNDMTRWLQGHVAWSLKWERDK